jgi:hypothetical protein
MGLLLLNSHIKIRKKTLLNRLDELDKKTKTIPLDSMELNIKYTINNILAHSLSEEECFKK